MAAADTSDTSTNTVVTYERVGAVAVITLANPPVNALSQHVRTGIAGHLAAADADEDVAAIVIAGAGRNLCGGADIREFNTPARDVAPMSRDLMNLIEASEKPIVAAVRGPTLGGGLELAMGCHYRVADAAASLGMPEVLRGIIPGAGGTQRLPRLIGLEPALEMISGGAPITAAQAHARGLVDDVADADPTGGSVRTAAIAFAEKLAADGIGPRRISEMSVPGEAAENAATLEAWRAKIEKTARGVKAPSRCVEAVGLTLTLPFMQGWAREAEISREAMQSSESKALIHAFFAEREAAKLPDIAPGTPVRPIARAVVLGAGTMGGGIAMSFANGGIPVTLIETSAQALDAGMARIAANYAATVKRGRLSEDAMAARLALISPGTDMAAVAEGDIVVEAVFEEMDVKKAVFAELDRLAKPDAILATNTSTLDVDAIAAATGRPESVLGTHFFSPANVMTLLEVVRAAKTAPEMLASVMALAKRIGKTAVVAGVCDGFIGNRMLAPYFRQADFLIEEGALPQDVDRVIESFGFRMGPLAVSDLAGLDISWAIENRRAATRDPGERFSPLLGQICEKGRFGQKTGAGWYRYAGRDRIPDPEIEALIAARSAEMGIERRTISDDEILQRCLYPLINEGAVILEEGMALRASDIDVVWLHGYGFPRHRGGPMFWADTLGLGEIVATLDRYHAEWGDKWAPAPLLRRLAEAGESFAAWDRANKAG